MPKSGTKVSASDSSSSSIELRGVWRECELCEASQGCFVGRLIWLDVSELLCFRCVEGPGILLTLPGFEGSKLSKLLLRAPHVQGFGSSIMHSVLLRPFVWHRLQITAPGAKRQRAFARLHGTQAPRLGAGSENGIGIMDTSV